MSKRILLLVVVSLVAMLAGTPSAQAQSTSSEMVANVAFEFTAADQVFPAGSYLFTRRSAASPWLVIRHEAGGENTRIPVLTRLALRDTSVATERSVVFDRVGDVFLLSEIWMPGEDGFLMRDTAEVHQHEIVPLNP